MQKKSEYASKRTPLFDASLTYPERAMKQGNGKGSHRARKAGRDYGEEGKARYSKCWDG